MNDQDKDSYIYWPDVILARFCVICIVILVRAIIIDKSLDDIPVYETTVVTTGNTTETTETIIPSTEETIHIEPTETLPEASEPPTTAETIPEVDPHDVELLALVIYQEAGGDAICDDCRRRVADVVLNRVADDRYPDTIEGVITQKAQYGELYWTGPIWPGRSYYASERHAVERAYRIAEEVLNGQHSELYGEGWVYQAEFKQGETFKSCCGIYFGR